MRLAILVVLAVVACAPARQSFRATTPTAPGDAYTCVLQQLAANEYEVRQSDRDAGMIRAEKPTLSSGMAFLAGNQYFAEMAITVLPAEGGAQINAIVTKTQEKGSGRSSVGQSLKGSEVESATAILAACGSVQAVQQ